MAGERTELRGGCENDAFSLSAGPNLRSPVYGLNVFLGYVEVLCKKQLSEGGIVLNVGVKTIGCLGDAGNGI